MQKILALFIFLISSLYVNAEIVGSYAFSGRLGSNIDFRLDLKQMDNGIVSGQTTYYRKSGDVAAILVVGYCEQNGKRKNLVLKEFNGNRNCGDFNIVVDNGNFSSGYWSYMGKKLDMSDINEVPLDESLTYFVPSSASEISGSYGFVVRSGNPNVGDYSGSCTLKSGAKQIGWQMHQATPNVADGEGQSDFDGSCFRGNVGDFQFIAYVDRRYVFVMRTRHDTPLVEFGFGATLEGAYIREE